MGEGLGMLELGVQFDVLLGTGKERIERISGCKTAN